MNNLDFEKTQVWVKNLVNASQEPRPEQSEIKPLIPLNTLPKKPEMKKLSQEEKMILAAGGALAIGLGAIVISSLSDESLPEKAAAPAKDLTAPRLDFGTLEEPEKPGPPSIMPLAPPSPAPAHVAPKKHEPAASAAHHPAEKSDPHPLAEIPDHPEVATTVTDDLTFIAAFNKAREEVGPAGLFAWKNTYYSTFTDKEWDGISDEKQERWLNAAQPIIEPAEEIPVYENQSTDASQSVVIVERGSITWMGIDKNGDGQTEILMARIQGQAPMVMMDTDGDGILDTRYDYEVGSGKTFASEIQPFAMSTADVEHLEEVAIEPDMGFYNNAESREVATPVPVSIQEENGRYLVSVDSNMDNTIDALTFLSDEHGPLVGLDQDNDGQIELGFVYHSDNKMMTTMEMEPLEEMNMQDLENADFFPDTIMEFTYSTDPDDADSVEEDQQDEYSSLNLEEPEADDYNAYS